MIRLLESPGFTSFATLREARALPGRMAKVTITGPQWDILRAIRNAPTASSQPRQRAAIVLSALEERSDREIVAAVGLSRRQVST